MATDYYDTLSGPDQATFRATLFAVVPATACPTVDMSGATSPDAFTDAGNRALAIDCAQIALGLPPGGTLDKTTYDAIMKPGSNAPQPWSTQKKVAVGAAAVGGAALLWWLLKKKKRR